MKSISYSRHRFPPVIIQHAIWLYFRFTLSYRDVEDLLAERGIDDEGEVLDVLLQSRRNKTAALKFLRHMLKKHQATPNAVVTDKWQASMSAVRDVLLNTDNLVGKRLNNRIENSHQPTRRRERKLQRFKSAKSAQRFLSTFSTFYNHFNIQRHLISRATMKSFRTDVLSCWRLAVSA